MPSYGDIDIRAALRESTEASGVPYHLEDPAAMAALARMFAPLMRADAKKPAGGTTGLKTSSKGQTE